MYYVYILRSLRNNRLYTGLTSDLKRRFEEHNSGRSKYTKSTRPFKLLYVEEYSSKAEAVARECFLKSGKGREWLNAQLKLKRGD